MLVFGGAWQSQNSRGIHATSAVLRYDLVSERWDELNRGWPAATRVPPRDVPRRRSDGRLGRLRAAGAAGAGGALRDRARRVRLDECGRAAAPRSRACSWSRPETRGIPPTPRGGHTLTLIDAKLVIFGGGDLYYAFSSEQWHERDLAGAYRLDTTTWAYGAPSTSEGTEPEVRGGHGRPLRGRNERAAQLAPPGGRRYVAPSDGHFSSGEHFGRDAAVAMLLCAAERRRVTRRRSAPPPAPVRRPLSGRRQAGLGAGGQRRCSRAGACARVGRAGGSGADGCSMLRARRPRWRHAGRARHAAAAPQKESRRPRHGASRGARERWHHALSDDLRRAVHPKGSDEHRRKLSPRRSQMSSSSSTTRATAKQVEEATAPPSATSRDLPWGVTWGHCAPGPRAGVRRRTEPWRESRCCSRLDEAVILRRHLRRRRRRPRGVRPLPRRRRPRWRGGGAAGGAGEERRRRRSWRQRRAAADRAGIAWFLPLPAHRARSYPGPTRPFARPSRRRPGACCERMRFGIAAAATTTAGPSQLATQELKNQSGSSPAAQSPTAPSQQPNPDGTDQLNRRQSNLKQNNNRNQASTTTAGTTTRCHQRRRGSGWCSRAGSGRASRSPTTRRHTDAADVRLERAALAWRSRESTAERAQQAKLGEQQAAALEAGGEGAAAQRRALHLARGEHVWACLERQRLQVLKEHSSQRDTGYAAHATARVATRSAGRSRCRKADQAATADGERGLAWRARR